MSERHSGETLGKPISDNKALRFGIKAASWALGASVCLGGPVMVDSWVGYISSYRETGVVAIDTKEYAANPDYDPQSVTVFLNGLGRDISCEQAAAMQPVVGKYGKVACLIYPSSFNAEPVAGKIYDEVFGGADTNAKKHITIVASSMGDSRGVQLAKILFEKHKVITEGLIINTGPGPLGKQRVKNTFYQSMIDNSCGMTPGKLLMTVIEFFNHTNQGKRLDNIAAVQEVIELGFAYNNRVVSDQMCELSKPLNVEAKGIPPIGTAVYMEPDNPANDTIVDTENAARDWAVLLPNLQIKKIGENVTHDNISYRPDVFRRVFDELFRAMREKRIQTEQIIKSERNR